MIINDWRDAFDCIDKSDCIIPDITLLLFNPAASLNFWCLVLQVVYSPPNISGVTLISAHSVIFQSHHWNDLILFLISSTLVLQPFAFYYYLTQSLAGCFDWRQILKDLEEIPYHRSDTNLLRPKTRPICLGLPQLPQSTLVRRQQPPTNTVTGAPKPHRKQTRHRVTAKSDNKQQQLWGKEKCVLSSH